MARAVELDRPPLPDVGARGWSIMRRGIVTPASDRWQEMRKVARDSRGEDWSKEIGRNVESAEADVTRQDRTTALGPEQEKERALELKKRECVWQCTRLTDIEL